MSHDIRMLMKHAHATQSSCFWMKRDTVKLLEHHGSLASEPEIPSWTIYRFFGLNTRVCERALSLKRSEIFNKSIVNVKPFFPYSRVTGPYLNLLNPTRLKHTWEYVVRGIKRTKTKDMSNYWSESVIPHWWWKNYWNPLFNHIDGKTLCPVFHISFK